MSSDNKSEQATPQRRKKAREQGQVARTRELPAALAVMTGIVLIGWSGGAAVEAWRDYMRTLLNYAAVNEMRIASPVAGWTEIITLRWAAPAMLAAWFMATASSLAQGGIVIAPEALQPKLERLSPANKIKQLFSLTSVSSLLKSLIPGTFILYLAIQVGIREWPRIAFSANRNVNGIAALGLSAAFEIGWKGALIMLAWAGIDYMLVRQKFEGDLMMSREDIREEMKQSEGNPATKSRIRRLQRQVRRSRMMQDVQKATVIIANPTHFAIALQYEANMPAPIVLAKGRDLIALQIKQTALWHGIPIVENPPLAHALYRAVQVGQAIPAKLYTAVAEILAFVYRMQAKAAASRRPAQSPQEAR